MPPIAPSRIPSTTIAATDDATAHSRPGVVHPPHLHERQPHLGHRVPGARLLRGGCAGDRHLPVADRDAERGSLHRPDRHTRVLFRAEGARVDECDVNGVGVVVDDCGGAGVVADHSDLDAFEPGVFEFGDGRDRSRRLRLQGDPDHAVRLNRGQHLQARRRGQRRPRIQLRDLDHGAVGPELPAVVRTNEPAVGDGALGELSTTRSFSSGRFSDALSMAHLPGSRLKRQPAQQTMPRDIGWEASHNHESADPPRSTSTVRLCSSGRKQ